MDKGNSSIIVGIRDWPRLLALVIAVVCFSPLCARAVPIASNEVTSETVSSEAGTNGGNSSVSDRLPVEGSLPASPQPQVRYRLSQPESPLATNSISEHKTDGDFTWQAITASGPASGIDPLIGEASGKSYFDFRDGIEHPYYILKLQKPQ